MLERLVTSVVVALASKAFKWFSGFLQSQIDKWFYKKERKEDKKEIDEDLNKLIEKREAFKKAIDEAIDGTPITEKQRQELINAARELIRN